MPKFTKPSKERFTKWSSGAMSDTLFKSFLLLWLLPLVLTLSYTALVLNKLPSQVPLFYSHIWGEQQLASRSYLLVPTIGTLLLGVFNLGLGINFYVKDKVLTYLLAGIATLVSWLSCITVFNIINLIK